jgi:uncharacterized protein YutE (UPF0331/DUF86 family)
MAARLPLSLKAAMSPSWSDRPPGIVRILRTDVGAMLAPVQPSLVYVYGSAVTGLARPDSDVDFGIDLADTADDQRPQALLWARQLLRDGFGSSRIDVGDLGRTDSCHYLVHVVTKGLCLYASEPARRLAFEDNALRQAGDLPATRALTWEAVKARFREELAAETGLIERDKLEKVLWQSVELLRFIAPYRSIPRHELFDSADFSQRFSVAHGLRLQMECVLTMARHLMLALGWGRAHRPADILAVICRRGVIPEALCQELVLILALKDPLTHPGEPVDWDLVHDVLQHRLSAFTAFNRHLVLFLDGLGV